MGLKQGLSPLFFVAFWRLLSVPHIQLDGRREKDFSVVSSQFRLHEGYTQ